MLLLQSRAVICQWRPSWCRPHLRQGASASRHWAAARWRPLSYVHLPEIPQDPASNAYHNRKWWHNRRIKDSDLKMNLNLQLRKSTISWTGFGDEPNWFWDLNPTRNRLERTANHRASPRTPKLNPNWRMTDSDVFRSPTKLAHQEFLEGLATAPFLCPQITIIPLKWSCFNNTKFF